jgi:hypothetical protein
MEEIMQKLLNKHQRKRLAKFRCEKKYSKNLGRNGIIKRGTSKP